MTTVNYNGKQMELVRVESMEGAIALDIESRGFEPAFYTLVGKRGGVVTCLKSKRTGEFVKF
jgi:hypothetical protein